MKVAAFVLIGLISQTVFAGETKFSFDLGQQLAAPDKVGLSKLAERKDISTDTLVCVGELKSKLVASPKFRSIRHFVKEVIFSDDYRPSLDVEKPELKSFDISSRHDKSFWSRKPIPNALLMNFSFAGALCKNITAKQIDDAIDAWLEKYAAETADRIQGIEKINASNPEKAQSNRNRKTVESAPADPRAGRIDDVRRRIHATEADGGVDTGRIR